MSYAISRSGYLHLAFLGLSLGSTLGGNLVLSRTIYHPVHQDLLLRRPGTSGF